MSDTQHPTQPRLERTLGPLMLWGLGVGYVISGMYFGWNLGLREGGTLGLAIATGFIVVMYLCFTFSYTELACAIPKAGGAFDYADRAFGRNWGFVAGWAQIIEFVFAPPAIAAAIGAYFGLLTGGDATLIGLMAYLLFTTLNIIGVKAAATFELVITILAVAELLLFSGLTLPHFQLANLSTDALPNGYAGIFAAVPFAIWFFLAIEGVANVAEETVNPQRNVLIGFGSAILTLVVLCILTFVSSVGVAGWQAIVFNADGTASDSPLPLALSHIVGDSGLMYHLLVSIGLLGLVASFHGIILAAGRATFEFGRVGMAPTLLGKVHPRFHTPANALVANMLVGMLALITGKTADIITIACFGAITLYIISMASLIRLRQSEPHMPRPFKVPFYPLSPMLALGIAVVALLSMAWFNHRIAIIYAALLAASYVGYRVVYRHRG